MQTFVACHERLSVESLPPYAPALNPMELVWAYVKHNVLGDLCERTAEAWTMKLVGATYTGSRPAPTSYGCKPMLWSIGPAMIFK